MNAPWLPALTTNGMVTSLFCLLVILLLKKLHFSDVVQTRLPPGPKAMPIVGNIFQLPRKHIARTYASWSQHYGPIYHLDVLGRHFVVINSLDIAKFLFEKRSATYSHRPRLVMAAELVGRDTMLFMNYGSKFRRCRKLMSTLINPRTASKYWPVQEAESLKLVLNMKQSSGDILQLCRWAATALIIRLLYGVEVKDKDNELVHLAEDFARLTSEASQPGRWLVDSFPSLRHIPTFIPGAHFKIWALQARARIEEFSTVPFNMVKRGMATGSIVPCWTAEQFLSATEPMSAEQEHDVRITATSLYSGGSDTSGSVLATFVLMMVRNPDVQRKAQAEVDWVTAGRWVPGMKDRHLFPYVNCLIKELFRINPVVHLVPHSLIADDVFEGYRIPKGTWVMANMWAFMYDEERYPEPYQFLPERYEEGEGRQPQVDPTSIVFGFGRRLCPGMSIGQASVFLSVIHILFALNVHSAKDVNGMDVIPAAEFTDTHVSHPKPFPYVVQERSAERIALVEVALQQVQA